MMYELVPDLEEEAWITRNCLSCTKVDQHCPGMTGDMYCGIVRNMNHFKPYSQRQLKIMNYPDGICENRVEGCRI